MFQRRHLSKDAFDRFWDDVRAQGDIVDVHWTDRLSVVISDLVDGAARNMFKRATSDPHRLRFEQTWQAATERAAAFVECWTRD